MENQLSGLGFELLGRTPGVLPEGMYHTGIDFVRWDLEKQSLHFSLHGTGGRSGTGINRELNYDLGKHEVRAK